MTTTRALTLLAIAVFGLIAVLAATPLDLLIIDRMTQLPRDFRNVLTYLTELGKSEYYLVPALVLALFFVARKQARQAGIAFYVFACIALSGLVVNLLKFLIGRARPKEWLEAGAYGIDPFTLASRWHSFPSGHANTMMALVISLVPFLPPAWRLPLAVWAGCIIATRPVLAAHYISDILGGMLVAVLVCYAVENMARRRGILPA